ncbi:MAG: hypothetical protein KAW90_02635 [Dehalococcoidales bacterium]|nr:hypothetical protein [Dehalococcoidales bacterium]
MNEIIYEKLKEVARERTLTNYTEIGLLVDLEPHNSVLWGMLDDINHYERRKGRHMLSAVVISQTENKPGSGFFECARNLGVFRGGNELLFWINELNRVWDDWSSH